RSGPSAGRFRYRRRGCGLATRPALNVLPRSSALHSIPDPPAAAATRDHVGAERGTLCNRGAASIADEWWSTIIQFPPSFTKVKLYRAGNVFVSPSFTYENV